MTQIVFSSVMPDTGAALASEGLVSLDRSMVQALSRETVAATEHTQQIAEQVSKPGELLDANRLVKMQQDIGAYSLRISLLSTLVRKGVAAVETVVKG